MKTKLTKHKWIVLSVLFMMLFTVKGYSQANNYNCCIKNQVQTSPSTMEFDVWIEWTGTNTQKLTLFQAGINFNYAGIANGGVMTGAFKAGSADPSLPVVQQAPNWNINGTSKQIRMLAAIATPSAIATAIPPPPGFRLGTFVITNTQPFTTSSTPNFVWSFVTGTATTTITQVSCYLNGATTGNNITIPAQHCVAPPLLILNPPCPIANAGGPYTTCGDVHLNGTVTNAYTSSVWSSTGAGTFDPDANTLNATYHPTAADLGSGVTLTLTADDGPAGCAPSSSSVVVNFTPTDDANACTVDGCDQSSGTPTHTPLNVDDGNACTNDGCDPGTGATHTPVNPDDGNPCTDDFCDTATGVYHSPTNVDDGNACTTDACDSSTGITHTAVNTDDGDVCTIDACNPSTGAITHTPVNVDDGNACTVDACAPGFGAPVTLTFGNASGLPLTWASRTPGVIASGNFDEASLPVSGFPAGSLITDVQVSVNVAHTWGGDILMVLEGPGPAFPFVGILDGLPEDPQLEFGSPGGVAPTLPYAFNNGGGPLPATGPVPSPGPYLPVVFDQANNGPYTTFAAFNGTNPNGTWTLYIADPVGGDGGTVENLFVTISAAVPAPVITHTPVNTDDGNACTTDACNTVTGDVSHTPVNTDDGDACTTDACDTNTGAVTHTAVNTDDGNACTTDACNPSTGAITHTAVNTDDGNACTTDACDTNTGAVTHTAVNTDDGNACTTDACNTSTGAVTHTAVNTDDGNACTTDACDTNTGAVTHTAVNTDDGNACTIDACNTLTGAVTHVDITDDGNACTDDACDTNTGIATHTPVNTDDGNACTTDGCNPSTGVFHTPVNTDDGNPCTVDACDTNTGAVTHTDETPVVTATAGTIACYGGTTCVTVDATGGQTPYTGTGVLCGYGAGDYTFTVTDAKGCSANSGNVHIDQPTKLTLSPSSTPSSGADGTASANASGGTPPYSYLWSDGQTTDPATGLAPGTYNVVVTDANGCTETANVTVPTSCNLDAPGPVTGPDGACKKQSGVVYCATPNPFATSYIWTLPAGVVATGATNGPCITVKFTSKFKGGFICVQAVTPCGTTPPACKNVVLVSKKPETPGVISGPVSLCPGDIATYSIAPVLGATGYEWKEDHLIILSGQGTTSVTVQAEPGFNSGKIQVRSINCKDHSGWRSKNISKNPPQPGVISGPATLCPNQTATYSIASVQNASSYVWSEDHLTILSGQGTTSVTVQADANFNDGKIKVKALSPCGGTSPERSLNIDKSAVCRLAAGSVTTELPALSSLVAYPNPTSGKAQITFSSDRDAKYVLKVVDMIGKVLITESLPVVEGFNQKDINLEGMPKGIYLISVQTENGNAQTLRLVVE